MEDKEKQPSPFLKLWRWGKPYHCEFIGSVLLAVLGVASQMIPYFCIARMIKELFSGGREFSFYLEWCLFALAGPAVVGDSGSGKSTILNLISKYYQPQKGKVTIGGYDISRVPSEEVLTCISSVDQDVFLFNDTIRNNIRYARNTATDQEIEAACRLANCDCFIQKMPQEYETMVGENGNKLSGGERQRLSVARAIIKDSPIILLDEATASLDIENELLVKQAIANLLAQQKTVVMIAHTLSIVRHADQILVVSNGGIGESGTHEQLLSKKGKYARMWEAEQKIAV